MTQPNRVVIALSAIFAGAAAGTAVATFCVWISWRGWSFLSVVGDPSNIVFAGNFVLGPVTAFMVTWARSVGIDETWRRAALSVTAAMGALGAGFGAFGVSMMAMMIVSPVVSNALVPGYFVVAVAVAYLAMRVSRKHRVGGQTPA